MENKISKYTDLIYKSKSSLLALCYSCNHSLVMRKKTIMEVMEVMVMGGGHERGYSGWFTILITSIFLEAATCNIPIFWVWSKERSNQRQSSQHSLIHWLNGRNRWRDCWWLRDWVELDLTLQPFWSL